MNGAGLRYHTGEEIQAGDTVSHSGHLGQVKFVANPSKPTPETQSFIEEFGGGVMVKDRQIGLVFLSIESMDDPDDLTFVARSGVDQSGGRAQ